MARISSNPALIYSKEAVVPNRKQLQEAPSVAEKKERPSENKIQKEKVEITEEAKQLQEKLTKIENEQQQKRLSELSSSEKAYKIHAKKFGNVEKPGIYFVSGFDWFGAGSIKGNYDGVKDMAEAITGANHFGWDQQDEIIEDIMSRKPEEPIVLVGHSFGGDSIVEIANRLNTIDHGFRKIALMITLDSVGFNNDEIPQNVKKNVNYTAQGPYHFLNDGPNIAANYNKTKIENYLRHEVHSDLDDAIDIQVKIMDEIDQAVQPGLA